MGYRANLYLIDNEYLEKLKKTSKKYLWKALDVEDDFLYRNDLLEHFGAKNLYDLGEPDYGNRLNKFKKRLLKSKYLHEKYNDQSEMMILEKEGFEELLKVIHEKNYKYYKKQEKTTKTIVNLVENILSSKNKTIKKKDIENIIKKDFKDDYDFYNSLNSLKNGINSMVWEWEKDARPYSLEGESLTSSWKYEYAIFELLRIYKSIDWENNTLIYIEG